jgi:glucosamine-6-phosphate deaminase
MKMVDSFEKIPLAIFPDAQTGSEFVATQVAALIREKQKNNSRCVLGLSTGKSPLKVYAELIRMHREEGLSFRNVYNLN